MYNVYGYVPAPVWLRLNLNEEDANWLAQESVDTWCALVEPYAAYTLNVQLGQCMRLLTTEMRKQAYRYFNRPFDGLTFTAFADSDGLHIVAIYQPDTPSLYLSHKLH